MRYSMPTVLMSFMLALPACGQSTSQSLASSGVTGFASREFAVSAGQERAEKGSDAASAALTKLGVPLGSDPSGRIRWIEAPNGELGDEALLQLPKLPYVEWLEIGGGKVTPAGTDHLKECLALKRLYIHDIDLSKDSLAWIANLRLDALSLQRTGVNGSALKQLKAAATLTVLNLSENGITDDDMGAVARFTNLEVLALQHTKVTGAGLAELRGMKRLNVLNLVNCHIVDADLSNLVTMPNLRIVHAAGCNISDPAVKDITTTLPMLAIFR